MNVLLVKRRSCAANRSVTRIIGLLVDRVPLTTVLPTLEPFKQANTPAEARYSAFSAFPFLTVTQ